MIHKNRTSNYSLEQTAINLDLDNSSLLGILKKSG